MNPELNLKNNDFVAIVVCQLQHALFTNKIQGSLIMKDHGAVILTKSRLALIAVVTAGIALFFVLDGMRTPLDQIAFPEMFSRQQSVT